MLSHFVAIALLFSIVNSQIVGVCTFNGTSNNPTTSGTLTLTFDPILNQTNITGTITGMPLNSIHGIHIHAHGDLSDTAGGNTGGHWNPFGGVHSHLNNPNRHAGDLGNITTDAQGTATVNIVSNLINLTGINSAIGKGMIIHQTFDDGATQPTGNSGSRFGQCVIGIKNVAGNQAFQENTKFATCELRGAKWYIHGRILFTQNADVRIYCFNK